MGSARDLASSHPPVVDNGGAAPNEGASHWDIDLRIDIPPAAHGAIEPRAAVARHHHNEQVEIWAGSQDAFFARDVVSRALRLSPEQVRVRNCRIGGAFGARVTATVELEAAVLAERVGRPVKVQWTRQQELVFSHHRPASHHHLQAKLEGDRIRSWSHSAMSAPVIFTEALLPKWFAAPVRRLAGDPGASRGQSPVYDFEETVSRQELVPAPYFTGPWRALGAGPNGLAIEAAMNSAAQRAAVDPVAFRLAHITQSRLRSVLREAARIARWSELTPEAGESDRFLGVGTGVYHDRTHVAVVAEASRTSGDHRRISRIWCVIDCGRVFDFDRVVAQCESNLVWSLGMVNSDNLLISDGRIEVEGFDGAPVPRISDAPEIFVSVLPSSEPPTGVGEAALVAAPAAILAALRPIPARGTISLPLGVSGG